MSDQVLVLVDHDRGTVADESRQAFAFVRSCLPNAQVAAVVIGGDAPPVIVGADTIRLDDPLLTVRRCTGPHPVRVVIDPERVEPWMFGALKLGPGIVCERLVG